MIALGQIASAAGWQDGAPAPPAFDVASVKRHSGVERRIDFRVQPGSFVATNVPVLLLLQHAYGLNNEGDRIVGAPPWVWSERFEVNAKFSTDDQRQVPLMVQALLADRFKLVAHKETRPVPVYILIVVKNGTLGRGLKPTAVDCSVPRAGCGTKMDNGALFGGGATMSQVSNSLSFLAGRTVIDKTGVEGRFDFEIRFSNPRLGVDNDEPPIFTVLQEQLGLKLIPDTQPLEVLVIDRIERPSEN